MNQPASADDSISKASAIFSTELSEMEKVANALFERLSGEMGFTFFSVNIVDEPAQLFRNIHAVGITEMQKGQMWSLKDLADNIRLHVINEGSLKVLEGPAEGDDRSWYTGAVPASAVRVFVPIQLGLRVSGVIEAGFLKESRAAFTRDDTLRLEAMVRRATGSFENARLIELLNQERHLLHTLMDNIPDSIYFKDTKSRFIRASRALARKIGLTNPNDIIGKTDFDIFTKEHAQQAYDDERNILKTGVPEIDIEEKETWADSRITWVSTTKMPLCADDGQIIGTFGVSRDITNRKEMEDALRFRLEFEEHITSLSSTFINLDLQYIDGAVTSALKLIGTFTASDRCIVLLYDESNTTVEKGYDWCRERGATASGNTLPHIEMQLKGWLFATMTSGTVVNLPSPGELPSGAQTFRETLLDAGIGSLLYVPLIYSGALAGVIGIESIGREKKWPTDTTALLTIAGEVFMNAFLRKRAEEKLHKANQVLELRVAERTGELKNANDQLTTHIGQLQFLNAAVYRLSPIITMEELLPTILDLFTMRFSGAQGGLCLCIDKKFKCICVTTGMESLDNRQSLEDTAERMGGMTMVQPILIEDRLKNEIFKKYSWTGIRELRMVFLVPLIVDAACVAIVQIMTTIDHAGAFSGEQFLLTTLASHAAICMSNAQHYEHRAEKARLDGELNVARSIQQRFTPDYRPDIPGIDLKGLYYPAYKVGGDYLDYFKTEQDDWVIAVADVCGKGIPAALLMTTMRSAFRIEGRNETSASRLLCAVNRFMSHNLDEKLFVTALCIIIAKDGKKMSYARAGHPLLVRMRKGASTAENIGCNGIALGLIHDMDTFASMTEEKILDLEEGDSYLLYTDGVTEATDDQKNGYGFGRLKTVLEHYRDSLPEACVAAIADDIRTFTGGADRSDDLTILAFRVVG